MRAGWVFPLTVTRSISRQMYCVLHLLVDRRRQECLCGVFLVRPLKARRKVDRVPDAREIHAFLGAHAPEDHGSGVDADPDGYGFPPLRLCQLLLLRHCLADLHACLAGVLVPLRSLEHGHDLVADELVDLSAVIVDDRGLDVEVVVEHLHDLVRRHRLADRGEPADIGEQEREVPSLRCRLVPLGVLQGGGEI